MSEVEIKEVPRKSSRALLKAVVLVLFLLVAVYMVRFTPVKDYLTAETLGRLLDKAGIWAPVAFILIYAVGVCLFVPGTLITAIGAAIFGPYWGFLYVWVGAMIGASTAFFAGKSGQGIRRLSGRGPFRKV
jgi:uncharacterized membrane protein YdjX (TVP38/TMEM64 family)